MAAFRNVGWWLQSQDNLKPARAIVILGGGVPFRAIQAARLYRAGMAKEIWVTVGAPDLGDQLMAKMGIPITLGGERDRSEEIVQALGVPQSAIREIPEPAANTIAEMGAVRRYAGEDRSPLIVVTSRYHVRRVRIVGKLVAREAGGGPAVIVRYAEEDPYDTGHWWHSSTDAISTFREVFGIVNAWAGFPVSPRDR